MAEKKWRDFEYGASGDTVLKFTMPRYIALDIAEKCIAQAKWERVEVVELLLIGDLGEER